MKIQKSVFNYTNSSCGNFNQKCLDTFQLYTIDALFSKIFQCTHFYTTDTHFITPQ